MFLTNLALTTPEFPWERRTLPHITRNLECFTSFLDQALGIQAHWLLGLLDELLPLCLCRLGHGLSLTTATFGLPAEPTFQVTCAMLCQHISEQWTFQLIKPLAYRRTGCLVFLTNFFPFAFAASAMVGSKVAAPCTQSLPL
eukprot:s5025_g6.t1